MAVATTVKMDAETKSRLERLQALIKLETGRKVTQQELLELLVEEGLAGKEALIDRLRDDREGLSAEEADRWLSWTFSEGEPVDEDGIDRVVYDEDRDWDP